MGPRFLFLILFALPLAAPEREQRYTMIFGRSKLHWWRKASAHGPVHSKTSHPHADTRNLGIHGGGWERGDKNGNSGALLLANEGFVTASLFYRLSGDSPFPADIEDCKCATRFLRANASK